MRGVTQTLASGTLAAVLLAGAIGSATVLATRGAWLWAVLAAVTQLALLGQWWLTRREGGPAERAADRLLALAVAALVVFYARLSVL